MNTTKSENVNINEDDDGNGNATSFSPPLAINPLDVMEMQGVRASIISEMKGVETGEEREEEKLWNNNNGIGAASTSPSALELQKLARQKINSQRGKKGELFIKDGLRWRLEKIKNPNHIVRIELSSARESVYIAECEHVEIEIIGKVNHIDIDQCTDVHVNISKGVISAVEMVNAKDVTFQSKGGVPTIQIDLSQRVEVILPFYSKTKVINASSTELYCKLMQSNGQVKKEFEIPYSMFNDQLVTKIEQERRETVNADKIKSAGYLLLSTENTSEMFDFEL